MPGMQALGTHPDPRAGPTTISPARSDCSSSRESTGRAGRSGAGMSAERSRPRPSWRSWERGARKSGEGAAGVAHAQEGERAREEGGGPRRPEGEGRGFASRRGHVVARPPVFNVSVFARPGLARGGAAETRRSAAGQGRGARWGPGGRWREDCVPRRSPGSW